MRAPSIPSSVLLRSRGNRRLGAFGLWVVLVGFGVVFPAVAAPLRVALIGADRANDSALRVLQTGLETISDVKCHLLRAGGGSGSEISFDALRAAQAAVFFRGPGAIDARDAASLREFLRSGRGRVILGATVEAWSALPEFLEGELGATPGEAFASGAPMSVINLFPHAIYAGIARFETARPMTAYSKLNADAQMLMEGTVGEETTPLAWVRQLPAGRMCHLVPADSELFHDAAFVRIVGNAVRWTANLPIAGAQAIVQRTYMPDSYPGAFAITFPGGPSVCFDPVRGGINYVWDGDFVDLRPRWLTKQGEPARIFGEVFYREKLWRTLRQHAPDHDSEFRFRGYAMNNGEPDFHYQIDGREVHETLRAGPGGSGVVRHFRVGPGAGPLWLNLERQPSADVITRGLERDGERACFPSSAAGEFTMEIRRKMGGLAR